MRNAIFLAMVWAMLLPTGGAFADDPWLVDLEGNPNETVNLFGEAKHAATVRTLTTKLLEYAKAHDDVYARRPKIRAAMLAASKSQL